MFSSIPCGYLLPAENFDLSSLTGAVRLSMANRLTDEGKPMATPNHEELRIFFSTYTPRKGRPVGREG